MNSITTLKWDSNFFKRNIGKITLERKKEIEVSNFKNEDHFFDCVYIFSKEFLPQEKYGLPINTKVLYRYYLDDFSGEQPVAISELKDRKFIKDLKQLAYQAGHFSRFKLDKNFSSNDFTSLYDKWVENCFQDESIIFAQVSNKEDLLGMITLDIKKNHTQISLIGVDDKSRGQNIGKKLIQAVFARSVELNKTYVDVYTQGENTGACKFYNSCGFKEINRIYIYHLWND